MSDNVKEISPRAELRERIVVKATESFTRNGIKCITMDDIAASLGISKRTLYEVFEDKETLLKECILNNQRKMTEFLTGVMAKSTNVLEVILVCYKRSIEDFHNTNKRFFEDIKRYPKIHEIMKNYRERDSDSTIAFFRMGVEQGIFRSDINFAIVNLLVREQLDLLMNTDICREYSFLDVYETIMFTYIRGISSEKGAKVLDEFIAEYRKGRLTPSGSKTSGNKQLRLQQKIDL